MIAGRLRLADVLDAFVGRDAGAGGEYQQGDDEAPEVQLAAVAERVQGVGGLLGTAQAVQQQHFVEGVDQRMHALAEHG
ncbi:hypothetical protein D3C73_1194150 [compost metagenome]